MTTLFEQIKTAPQRTFKMRDLGRVVTGKTPSKDNPADWGQDVDFITPTDFSGDGKHLTEIKRKISAEGVSRYKNMILPPETVIVTCIGSDMGKVVISQHTALTNQQINSIVVDRGSFDVDFVFYKLKSLYPELRSIAEEGGSTMPIITKTTFENIEFDAPELSIQQKIGEILSAYDEKIENNKKIIKNLETSAQALFDEWYVKFRFPGYEKAKFIESEIGDIPKGWEIKNLDQVADIVFGHDFQAKLFNESGLGVRVVRIRDVLDGATETFTTEVPAQEYQINVGDLLIGMDGTFHANFWFTAGCYLNQRVTRIRSNLPGYFIFESIRAQLNYLQKTITGATVGHLANGDIREFKILVPQDLSMMNIFGSVTKKILDLRKEILTLRESRDRLLAELI